MCRKTRRKSYLKLIVPSSNYIKSILMLQFISDVVSECLVWCVCKCVCVFTLHALTFIMEAACSWPYEWMNVLRLEVLFFSVCQTKCVSYITKMFRHYSFVRTMEHSVVESIGCLLIQRNDDKEWFTWLTIKNEV